MIYPFVGNFPVTRPFGIYDPVYSNYPDSRHPGTDYAVPFQHPYVAAQSGTVKVYARGNTTTGRGNEVCIVNGSEEVRYCHLDEIYVKDGQRVEQGQQVGTCGWTGFVLPKSPAGAHLHFELLVSGVYTDFEKYIKGVQMEKMNKGDIDNAWADMYGKLPTQADYDVWVTKTFKEFWYEKASIEMRNWRNQASTAFVPYNGKQLFTKK